ncbi:receptor-like protein EIX2 [Magnolia sinica]|uniref:receptor-like protein EIX2 n=1 Tax=Magnolia sinica TaxID=86752 RepID=UPI00265AD202|nr:receptor-like protein EIX2 [Magnolia sinica]
MDLSSNNLSGEIPEGLTGLLGLRILNLSGNHLTGKIPGNIGEIPSGNQLQTLQDPSIYMGNNGLCGPPLTNKCVSDETSRAPMSTGNVVEKDEEDNKILWFYLAMGLGFVAGFWAFCYVLMFNNSWRIAYYSFFDHMKERLFCNCCFTGRWIEEV